MIKSVLNMVKWIWQFPQNLCGIVYRTCLKDRLIASITNDYIKGVEAEAYLKKSKGSITLGKYIFIYQNYRDVTDTIRHECGHVKQSLILGPLYLIVIGIPSILHAALNNYIGCCKKHKKGYYHFYTESWANKLMDINT